MSKRSNKFKYTSVLVAALSFSSLTVRATPLFYENEDNKMVKTPAGDVALIRQLDTVTGLTRVAISGASAKMAFEYLEDLKKVKSLPIDLAIPKFGKEAHSLLENRWVYVDNKVPNDSTSNAHFFCLKNEQDNSFYKYTNNILFNEPALTKAADRYLCFIDFESEKSQDGAITYFPMYHLLDSNSGPYHVKMASAGNDFKGSTILSNSSKSFISYALINGLKPGVVIVGDAAKTLFGFLQVEPKVGKFYVDGDGWLDGERKSFWSRNAKKAGDRFSCTHWTKTGATLPYSDQATSTSDDGKYSCRIELI